METIPTIVTIFATPANGVVFSLLGNRSLFEYFDICNNQYRFENCAVPSNYHALGHKAMIELVISVSSLRAVVFKNSLNAAK